MIALCKKAFYKVKRDIKNYKKTIELPGDLGNSTNVSKSINGKNGIQMKSVSELRKNSGGSVGSHASSTGLITPKQKANGKSGTVFGTEMHVIGCGDAVDSAIRESCADGNSNTSHNGLGSQSDGLFQVQPRTASKAYVTHERLNEMGRCSTTKPAGSLGDGSHSVICQINDGSSQFTPSHVPARSLRTGYVQV